MPAGKHPPLRALVVDDDEATRGLLRRVLEEAGYEVSAADDGAHALDAIDKERFDVVVSDLSMPRLDGYSMLELLSESHPELPVLIVSGAGRSREVVEALRRGAAQYVSKPWRPWQLVEAVHRATAKARLGRPTPDSPAAPAREPAREPARASSPAAPAAPPRLTRAALVTLREACADGSLRIPEPPPNLSGLITLRGQAAPDLEAVLAAIGSSPTLARHVFGRANSAYYARQRPARNLREAAVRLGTRAAIDEAIRAIHKRLYRVESRVLTAPVQQAWGRARVASVLARALAQTSRACDPDDTFLATLFADLGTLMIFFAADRLLQSGTPTDDVMGPLPQLVETTHETLGARVIQRWRLPDFVAALAGAHHEAPGDAPQAGRVFKAPRLRATAMLAMAIEAQRPGQTPRLDPPLGVNEALMSAALQTPETLQDAILRSAALLKGPA